MGRRRGGRPIDGWLAIDKPSGMTSAAVVGKVRRLLDAAKVGHGGTLDPLATGVLPIALGEATKTVAYVMDGAKTYHFRVRWGEERSTDDGEGEVTATSASRPTADAIAAALPCFTGAIEQVPPAFSAIKVGGRRAYDLARAERPVSLAPRQVRVETFRLIGIPDADHADFEVRCGKGTYVRSLARDLARALGTLGHVALLRRISCGPFHESVAISLDKLGDLGHIAASAEIVLPIETALDDIPALAVTEAEARRLQNGQALPLSRMAAPSFPAVSSAGMPVRVMAAGRLVALARIEGGEIRPVRVINPNTSGVTDVDYR